ncbi:MAG TPA: hypothetical protein PKI20_12085 [Verrucomicrobiota bacterium]|nr:hypothetical protein [Verrucomicrobiota bacterium]HQL79848.1 hypothetical protein [Verrucomicrobiota bacterium]
MKSKVDPAFWRRFNTLPMQAQQLARNAFALWQRDPFHASLRFKKLTDDLWSVHIPARYPMIGPVYPRGAAGRLRQIAFRSYRSFDDVSEELGRVDTLHVWHDARQEPKF